MNILVINGPNLNMLGIREPGIYGRETYADLCRKIREHAEKKGIGVTLYQSNSRRIYAYESRDPGRAESGFHPRGGGAYLRRGRPGGVPEDQLCPAGL